MELSAFHRKRIEQWLRLGSDTRKSNVCPFADGEFGIASARDGHICKTIFPEVRLYYATRFFCRAVCPCDFHPVHEVERRAREFLEEHG